jgi:CHAT domain
MDRKANIIIASPDGDQLAELVGGANEIAEALKPDYDVSPRVATSIDDIVKKRSSETILLIIAASLPQNRSSSDEDDQPALDFVRSVAMGPGALPCILVSERLEHYRLAQGIKYCELLVVDSTTDYVDYCLQLARKLGVVRDATFAPRSFASPPLSPADPMPLLAGGRSSISPMAAFMPTVPMQEPAITKYAIIEVDLPANLNEATVRLEIHDGKEIRKSYSEPLRLKKSDVAQLVKECKGLKRKLATRQANSGRYYQRWQSEYQQLGERLGRLLWNTQSFTAFYSQGIGAADSNVRVRFNLEQPWFDGLWEAIPVRSGQRFLMLDNTIARRALQRDRLEVFSTTGGRIAACEGALRILVIKSNVDNVSPESPDDPLWRRYWERHGGSLAKLDHLEKEVDALHSMSDANVLVDVLPAADHFGGDPWSLAKETRTALETAPQGYDIVHFAGHALFVDDEKDGGRGYLVFSGYPRPQAISIATVATWMANAGVQLAYLSCCRSSAALAALEFARNNIPMAIGFHWDIEDEKAPAFAREFYQELLKSHLKVCPAISKARLNLFNGSQGSDPIWASPVLIAQPMDWIQVEAVLKLTALRPIVDRVAA